MAMTDDSALLHAIAAGDAQAFTALYEQFANRVYNSALGYVHNVADAEEITQDVFVEIFHAAAKFNFKSSVSTWVYRIAVNKALDRLRYNKRGKRFAVVLDLFGGGGEPAIDPPMFEHPGVLLEQKENAALVFQAIRKLEPSQQTAIVLSFVEQLPQQEVAEIMNISVKAVESLLQRAKGNLRKSLPAMNDPRRKEFLATSKFVNDYER